MSSVAGATATPRPGNAPAPDAASAGSASGSGSGSGSASASTSTAMSAAVYRTSDLRPTDVLLGRGYCYQRYPGNVALRSYVARYRSRYVKSKKVDKRRITSEIVAYVRAGGLKGDGANTVPYHDANASVGRFLRPLSEEEVKTQVAAGHVPSKDDCKDVVLWTDADDRTVLEKVQHQLRQLPKKSKRGNGGGKGGNDKKIGSSRRESTSSASGHTSNTTNVASGVNSLRSGGPKLPSKEEGAGGTGMPTSCAAVAVHLAAARADLRILDQISSSALTPMEDLDLLSPVPVDTDTVLEIEKESAMDTSDLAALAAKTEVLPPNYNLPKTKTTALASTEELNGLDDDDNVLPTLLVDEGTPTFAEQLLGQVDNFLDGALEKKEESTITMDTSYLAALDAKAELLSPNHNRNLSKTITTAEHTCNDIDAIISPTPIEKGDVECPPAFTEQDEKAELETLTAQDIRDVESDLRGIAAGVAKLSILVEGDRARVSHLLRRLDEELSRLPVEQRAAYSRAVVECPNLVNDDRKTAFLEREDNDPALAAVRLALHWQLRLEIFGPDRCFLPMMLDGAMKGEVADMVQQQTLHLLPVTDTAGRAILYLDPSHRELGAWNMEQELRWWWYFLEVAAEDPETRRSGVVLIANAANVQRQNFRGKFTSKLRTIMDSASPIRLRALHCCHARWFVPYVFHPVHKYFMGRAYNLRFKPHYGSTAKLLQDLESFCLPRDRVPKELGGEVILDMKEWVESRLVLEGSRPDSHVAMEQRPIYAPDGSLSKVRNKNTLPVDEKAGTAPRVGRRDSFDDAVADLYENGNLWYLSQQVEKTVDRQTV